MIFLIFLLLMSFFETYAFRKHFFPESPEQTSPFISTRLKQKISGAGLTEWGSPQSTETLDSSCCLSALKRESWCGLGRWQRSPEEDPEHGERTKPPWAGAHCCYSGSLVCFLAPLRSVIITPVKKCQSGKIQVFIIQIIWIKGHCQKTHSFILLKDFLFTTWAERQQETGHQNKASFFPFYAAENLQARKASSIKNNDLYLKGVRSFMCREKKKLLYWNKFELCRLIPA